MKSKISLIARLILGLIYFVFGLNGFFNFLPVTPPPMPEAATAYFTGLMGTGYFMPLLKATETLGGLSLVSGIGAPVALVILAPITLHILLFHAFFTPELQNLLMPVLMTLFHLLAATTYWHLYRPLFLQKK